METELVTRTKARQNVSCSHLLIWPVVVGLVLRLSWIVFESFRAGDTYVYQQLAFNWVQHGVYGWRVGDTLVPAIMRMPGYPAFLAVFYRIFGERPLPVQFAQALIDTGTIYVTGAIAARLAPTCARSRVVTAAIWFYALCPFTANFVPVLITEVLAIFVTALAVLLFASALLSVDAFSLHPKVVVSTERLWFFGGVAVAAGTLLRPEAPLLLVALVPAMAIWAIRPRDVGQLLRAGFLVALGFLLPLVPWAARNWHAFGRPQVFPPKYFTVPGEYAPAGFYSWARTWLIWYRDMPVVWAPQAHASESGLPASAFGSEQERLAIESAFATYNQTRTISPELDQKFAHLGEARTRQHPLRVHLVIPLARAVALWVQPRFLRNYGDLQSWRQKLALTAVVVLAVLNIAFLILVGWVAYKLKSHPLISFFLLIAIVRTGFVAYAIGWSEPRYTIELFPLLIAVIAGGMFALAKGSERELA